MSNPNSLSDEQIATIRSWADNGDQLSDIQKRLGDELEIKVTYLGDTFSAGRSWNRIADRTGA
jgi:hypothetical protein